MSTVVLEVRPLRQALAKAASTMRSDAPEPHARIVFATPELLLQVLTLKRWELLRALCRAGQTSISQVAHRVNRDVESVRTDIQSLADAGIVELDAEQVEFPFDRVKVEFMLEAA